MGLVHQDVTMTASISDALAHWLIHLEMICHHGKKLLFSMATAFLMGDAVK